MSDRFVLDLRPRTLFGEQPKAGPKVKGNASNGDRTFSRNVARGSLKIPSGGHGRQQAPGKKPRTKGKANDKARRVTVSIPGRR